MSPLLVPGAILLLPLALAIGFRRIALRGPENKRKRIWAIFRGLGPFVLAITVTGWWVIWDLRARSEFAPAITQKWPGTLELPTAERLFFWILPIVSLGIFLVLCYTVDRTLKKLRLAITDLVWLAWWRLVSFIIPLMMAATGFDAIFEGKVAGIARSYLGTFPDGDESCSYCACF